MLKLTLSFICIAFFSTFLKAQEQNNKWTISLGPAFISDPYPRFGIQPGVVYKPGKNLGILTELTVTPKMSTDPSYSNNQYLRIKSELRYIFSQKKSGRENYYYGLQLSYSYRKWNDLGGGAYFQKEDYYDSSYSYSSATITSPVITASLQMGYCLFPGKHFGIEIFGGAGIRGVVTEYSNIENKVKGPYYRPICKIFPSPDPAWWMNETSWRFHANLGFRFQYRF
jgi:hypothetical protein